MRGRPLRFYRKTIQISKIFSPIALSDKARRALQDQKMIERGSFFVQVTWLRIFPKGRERYKAVRMRGRMRDGDERRRDGKFLRKQGDGCAKKYTF